MLWYVRINVSEGTDTNKTDSSYECIIWHCWYFLKVNFIFHPKVRDSAVIWHKDLWALVTLQLLLLKGMTIELTFGSWLKARL